MDLISRQDAIDAIKTMPTVEALGAISNLPSAEPEIIRCKDCKHRSKSGLCNMWSVFGTVTTDDDMYCSYGERGDSDDE